MYTREEKQGIEDNNVHTSVVIEVANPKGEPEEQKSYQIKIDDLNAPKDYVIDQIFCGENITIYALFEVSENENRTLDKNLIKVTNSNIGSDNTFYYRNSCKQITNDRKFNVYKRNSSVMPSEESLKIFSSTKNRNNSFYCLKHPSGNYDLLTPERKKSDLKVLYSKNFSLERTKSTKFKAISVGVNTDIVQSPRIIEEVQKMLGMNVPVVTAKEKSLETTNSSSTRMPSFEITEMETQPSYSSFGSSTDSRNYSGKSVSNLYFVPFLMMEDDSLMNKLSGNCSSQKNQEEEKLLNDKLSVSKVSLGINTDESEFDSGIELNNKRQQNAAKFSPKNVDELSGILLKDDDSAEKSLKPNERKTILEEIKTMQLKLSALFKKIESSDFESECDSKDYYLVTSNHEINDGRIENIQNIETLLQNELEKFEKDEEDFDSLVQETPTASQDVGMEKKEERPTIMMDFGCVLPQKELYLPEVETHNETLEPEISVICSKISLKSSWTSVVSKSETNLYANKKINLINLKKSWSLDFKLLKTEVLKNIKNYSFKQEGCLSTNTKARTPPGKEVNSGDNEFVKKCELGDALKNINFRLVTVSPCEENEKKETPIETEKIDSNEKAPKEETNEKSIEPKKGELPVERVNPEENQPVPEPEENQPAPVSEPKENQPAPVPDPEENQPIPVPEPEEQPVPVPEPEPEEHQPVTVPEPEPSPQQSVSSYEKEPKPPDVTLQLEKKTCNETEKPPTPSGIFSRTIPTDFNTKKESKLTKRTYNRYKVTEVIKPETTLKKIIVGGRKPIKNIAESKLHIDKIIKTEGLKNLKTSSTYKRNLEKSTAKGDRSYRPHSQKLGMREGPADQLSESKTENKLLRKKSGTSLRAETPTKKSSSPKSKTEGVITSEEPDTDSASQKRNPLSSESSSVIVRLLSKKPKSLKRIHSKGSKECLNMENVTGETQETQAIEAAKETNESMEKPVVQSVWALTKVLLFEDGTKKLEVLEASLTPPKYSLNEKTSK